MTALDDVSAAFDALMRKPIPVRVTRADGRVERFTARAVGNTIRFPESVSLARGDSLEIEHPRYVIRYTT